MKHSIALIVFLVSISGCLSPNKQGIYQERLNSLLSLDPGKSTQLDVINILGQPERTYVSNQSKNIGMEYDLVESKTPHLKIPQTKVFIDPISKIVVSYQFSPLNGKKWGLEDIKAIFPSAQLKPDKIDYKKSHYIPATQVYRDAKLGLAFEYRKSDDTAFGFSVSTSQFNTATKF